MSAIDSGARQAVVNCVKVKAGDSVVMITDRVTETLADAVLRQVDKVGGKGRKFIMEDFGSRPEDGSEPLPFPEEIREALSEAQASFYMAQGKKGELDSFRVPMTKVVDEFKVRHAHMPNFIEEMMSQGMASDYGKIQQLCQKVYDIVHDAGEIRVTTVAGTDFTARFDNRCRWHISDGDIKPGSWCNLPDGEVFTAPASADGIVVVDGCLGDFFNKKYGRLDRSPLTYELKDGRCVEGSVQCGNEELKREFEEYTFGTDENSNRLGEFAIGTNVGLDDLIGNLLQDEKFPGIHVALGSPLPMKTGADWNSKTHNDGVLLKPTITVEGKVIMKDGEFLI